MYDGLPSDSGHNWRYLAFGPDGKLFHPATFGCLLTLVLEGTLPLEHLAMSATDYNWREEWNSVRRNHNWRQARVPKHHQFCSFVLSSRKKERRVYHVHLLQLKEEETARRCSERILRAPELVQIVDREGSAFYLKRQISFHRPLPPWWLEQHHFEKSVCSFRCRLFLVLCFLRRPFLVFCSLFSALVPDNRSWVRQPRRRLLRFNWILIHGGRLMDPI